ncbi:hypothetical protein HDV02_002954 [Globomyces sp. JEL0801]|nr:hypothetical protein HDV02_002954 [Globomyces sp. JEL0801]
MNYLFTLCSLLLLASDVHAKSVSIPINELPVSFTATESPTLQFNTKEIFIPHLNKKYTCDDFGTIQKCNIDGQVSIFEGLTKFEATKRDFKPCRLLHYWNYGTPTCSGWHLDWDRRLSGFYGSGTIIRVDKGTKTGGSISINVGLKLNAIQDVLGVAAGVMYTQSWEVSDTLSATFAPVPANHTGALILNAYVNKCSGMATRHDRCSDPKISGWKPYSGVLLRDNGGKPDGEYRIQSSPGSASDVPCYKGDCMLYQRGAFGLFNANQ